MLTATVMRARLLIPVTLAAAAASGCGQSTSESHPSSTASVPVATSTAAPPASHTKTSTSRPPANRRHPAVRLSAIPTGPAPERAPVTAPAQGDASLQRFGSAAPDREFVAVARAVQGFNLASARADGRTACALLGSAMRAQILQLYGAASVRPPTSATKGRSPSRPDCATILTAIFKRESPDYRRRLRHTRVVDARLKGDRGFAFYRAPGLPHGGFVPVQRVGGRWTIAAASGSSMP
jgi:hypothetical protein